MKLLDPTWIRDNVDYSFGDESGLSIGGYMKPANSSNGEFIQKYHQCVTDKFPFMTLFIDNMRLYRRDNYRYTAVEEHNEQWKQIRDNKVLQFANEDLLRLCASLPDMQFVIFTGFEDMPIDDGIYPALPENVITVYASNATVWGGKVCPVPYGIQRILAPNDDRQRVIQEYITEQPVHPGKLMYINFNPGNHYTRQPLFDKFSQYHWVTTHVPQPGAIYHEAARNYYGNIRTHKFMLCPSGNAPGCECHRDIETLYMRRVPIVEDTAYHHAIFDQLQAPVLYIDDLQNVSEQLLIDNDYLYQQMQTYDLNNLDIEIMYNKLIRNTYNTIIDNLKSQTV